MVQTVFTGSLVSKLIVFGEIRPTDQFKVQFGSIYFWVGPNFWHKMKKLLVGDFNYYFLYPLKYFYICIHFPKDLSVADLVIYLDFFLFFFFLFLKIFFMKKSTFSKKMKKLRWCWCRRRISTQLKWLSSVQKWKKSLLVSYSFSHFVRFCL